LYLPTGGRLAGFVGVVDAVVLVVDRAEVEVEDWGEVVEEDKEEVVEDGEGVVVIIDELDDVDLRRYRERRREPPQISVGSPEQTYEQSVDGAGEDPALGLEPHQHSTLHCVPMYSEPAHWAAHFSFVISPAL
jgi:hypothetical protein